MLEDKLKDCQKAIEAKRADVATKLKAFNDEKAKLAKNPDVDITNPEDPAVKAADEAMKPYSTAAEELKTLEGQFERLAMMQAAGGERTHQVRSHNELDRHPHEARETLGRMAANSEAYQQLRAEGVLADGSEVTLGRVQITDQQSPEMFAALLTGTSDSAGGVLNVPERFPAIYDLPQLPLNIMNLLTVGETSQNAVEFVRILARTIQATEVAEASTSADIDGSTVTAAAGGRKPESGLTFEEATEMVRTIAHTMPATRNQLADAPFLRTLVDSEMTDGVQRKAEERVMTGSGTAPQLRGILHTPGRLQYTQGDDAVGEPRADAVHRIFTMLALAGFPTTAAAFNDLDWQEIRLTKDSNGNYQFGPPSLAGQMQIWGKTAVTSPALPEGTSVAAQWKRGLFLVREGVKVYITDSHKDWFERNLLMLLAEGRGVLVIPRPQAFGELTLS